MKIHTERLGCPVEPIGGIGPLTERFLHIDLAGEEWNYPKMPEGVSGYLPEDTFMYGGSNDGYGWFYLVECFEE